MTTDDQTLRTRVYAANDQQHGRSGQNVVQKCIHQKTAGAFVDSWDRVGGSSGRDEGADR